MNREYRKKSQLCGGIALICMVFLLETWSADRQLPNAASPFIWAALGTVAAVAIGLAGWFRYKAGKARP
jgi:hypothetical protein